MSTEKRRGGYQATVEGIKKLKEAKRRKNYTYQQIKDAANVTIDQVKRLFNPQWGNGKYKISEDAVSQICSVLNLKPEEVVSDWYAEASTPYDKALQLIEQAAREEATELDLAGMELTELPAEIGKLSKLTKLTLGKFDQENFQIIGNNLSSLPAEIGQLTNLSVLDLRGNSLSSLPASIGQLTNLSVFYLRGNSLSSLPASIGQLTNLSVLDLRGNSLSSLPASIGQLTNLTRLDLDNNSLSSLPASIGQLTNLSVLDLR
ncbi:MAG: leucine-rich repeat domain-containing protein, partial [Cyanobacteria bacterium P01_G01_bin.39]